MSILCARDAMGRGTSTDETVESVRQEAMSELVIWIPDERSRKDRRPSHIHGLVPSAMLVMLSQMYQDLGWSVTLDCSCSKREHRDG